MEMNHAVFETSERHGYAVEFSPFLTNRLACAAAQNYGIQGCGTLFILETTSDGRIIELCHYDWKDGLFDVTWSEIDHDVVVTASGDGSIQLWNVTQSQAPIQVYHEHSKEVYGVDWSQTRKEHQILSASWDRTIKMWDPERLTSLTTFTGHSELVYSAIWSPHIPGCFASVSGDHTLRIWNTKKPHMASLLIPAHDAEVLTCDWCKYDQNIITTGGVDGIIRGWDLRNPRLPLFEKRGHQYAVRRVKFSPHHPTLLASVSYDFTTRIWDYRMLSEESLEVLTHHTEFVYGLDFNLHIPGQLVDCSWDRLVHIYTSQSLALKPE